MTGAALGVDAELEVGDSGRDRGAQTFDVDMVEVVGRPLIDAVASTSSMVRPRRIVETRTWVGASAMTPRIS